MSLPLNKRAFNELVEEDIAWLESVAPASLERDHIALCLRHHAALYEGGGEWRAEHPDINEPKP